MSPTKKIKIKKKKSSQRHICGIGELDVGEGIPEFFFFTKVQIKPNFFLRVCVFLPPLTLTHVFFFFFICLYIYKNV